MDLLNFNRAGAPKGGGQHLYASLAEELRIERGRKIGLDERLPRLQLLPLLLPRPSTAEVHNLCGGAAEWL